MRFTMLSIVSGLTIALLAGSPAAKEPEKELPPSFKPGANVTLAVTIEAPKQWAINPYQDIKLVFDEENLKNAPFSVEGTEWVHPAKKFDPEHPEIKYEDFCVIEIPIKLASNITEGTLAVPITLHGGICDPVSEYCKGGIVEEVSVRVLVKAKAPDGTKNQALSQGVSPWRHCISLP